MRRFAQAEGRSDEDEMALFTNRRAAGRQLIDPVTKRVFGPAVVLALSGGSVPVGYEVALGLGAPLDVLLTRQLVIPGHEDLALGFVTSSGVSLVDAYAVTHVQLHAVNAQAACHEQQRQLAELEAQFRSGRDPVEWVGQTLILVDDWAPTAARLQAAVTTVREAEPERLILAVPAATRRVCQAVQEWADDVVCLYTVDPPFGMDEVYEQREEPSPNEVTALLRRNAHLAPRPSWYRRRDPGEPTPSERRL